MIDALDECVADDLFVVAVRAAIRVSIGDISRNSVGGHTRVSFFGTSPADSPGGIGSSFLGPNRM